MGSKDILRISSAACKNDDIGCWVLRTGPRKLSHVIRQVLNGTEVIPSMDTSRLQWSGEGECLVLNMQVELKPTPLFPLSHLEKGRKMKRWRTASLEGCPGCARIAVEARTKAGGKDSRSRSAVCVCSLRLGWEHKPQSYDSTNGRTHAKSEDRVILVTGDDFLTPSLVVSAVERILLSFRTPITGLAGQVLLKQASPAALTPWPYSDEAVILGDAVVKLQIFRRRGRDVQPYRDSSKPPCGRCTTQRMSRVHPGSPSPD
ncbi:hypothetical protein BDV11DRAFT_124048 [Aspergillus similis]